MKSFFIFFTIIFLSGCTGLEILGNTSNRIINVLANKKEKSIFLVGDKYTYIYQDTIGSTPHRSQQYYTMNKLVNILKDSEGFSFVEKPEVSTKEIKMLDGTTQISSRIKLSVEIKPTQKQIDYFHTKKGYKRKNSGYLYVDGMQVDYKKTRCFLGVCDDRFIEYILHYRAVDVSTVKTTREMRAIDSKIHRKIIAHVRVSKSEERTEEELKEIRQKRRKKRSDPKYIENATFMITMMAVMVVSLPIALPMAAINSK